MKRAKNPTKMSQPFIPSYQKGGMVTKPSKSASAPDSGVYTAEMGKPPQDVDMMTSLTPAQRKAAEARMKSTQRK